MQLASYAAVLELYAARPPSHIRCTGCIPQIIDDISSLKLTKAGEPLEISLTKNLKHTGIMSTLTYTYSDASAVPTTTTTKSAAGGRQRGGDSRLGRRVCWMLFEYCDKGVMAVSSPAVGNRPLRALPRLLAHMPFRNGSVNLRLFSSI